MRPPTRNATPSAGTRWLEDAQRARVEVPVFLREQREPDQRRAGDEPDQETNAEAEAEALSFIARKRG
jgi:hypothetical protein